MAPGVKETMPMVFRVVVGITRTQWKKRGLASIESAEKDVLGLGLGLGPN